MRTFKTLAGALVGLFILSLFVIPQTYAGDGENNGDIEIINFSDVLPKHPFVKAIQYLQKEGVVEGYEDGTFKPETEINRAEFLKIVMEASDFEPGGSNCYPDVKDEWFAQYVCGATEAGLVQGYDDGTFKPEQNINFVEASKIVVNTLKLQEGSSGDNWFDPYVYALEDQQVIPFDINSFDGDLTRGQMAEMIWRIHANRTYKPAKNYSEVADGTPLGSDLLSFESCQELHDYFYDNTAKPVLFEGYEAPEIPADSIRTAISFAEKGGGAGVPGHSETNVQVEGVDEADIVKNDGEYIYYIVGSTIRIVEAYPPESMKVVSTIDLSEENIYPTEIYVMEDTLVIIGTQSSYQYFDDFTKKKVDPALYYTGGTTKVLLYDVADRNDPELMRELGFEGEYTSSRRVNETVYLVAKQENYTWPWFTNEEWKEEDLVPLYTNNGTLDKLADCADVLYMPDAIDTANYLIVSAIPLNTSFDVSSQVVLGSSSDVFSSPKNLYVAQTKYDWYPSEDGGDKTETLVHKFNLTPTRVKYQGMGDVPGTILNQFSMDEYEGNFRIVTTVGNVWDSENKSTNNLYVLDENLERIGTLEGLAPGERIYSARFQGERAYVVTFKKVDPLFVLSLEDPTNPEVLGELKIPGFSDYLHPYDENHVIGFGLDTIEATEAEEEGWGQDFAWYQGVKIAMFDITDVTNPKELHREIIGDRGTNSPLNYNHKALLYSRDKGRDGGALMGFPIAVAEISEEMKEDPETPGSTYGEMVFQGAYVYDVSPENGFQLRGKVTHYNEEDFEESGYYWYGPSDVERLLYIGDYLYTVSQNAVFANELEDLSEKVSEVAFGN